MIESLKSWLIDNLDWLQQQGEHGAFLAELITRGVFVAIVIILSVIANIIAKRVIVHVVRRVIERTETTKDDVFLRRKVFTKLSHLAPALVIYGLADQALEGYPGLIEFTRGGAMVYMILVGVLVFDSILNAAHDVYQTLSVSRDVPIKGFVQVVKVVLYVLGCMFVVAAVVGSDTVLGILGGLGALTAVMMLIFKDSILGLVAGVQLIANRMVAKGDWIEMPKYGADGDVIDIALTTVKVQNWDKTISTIPTYALISDSFKNWRGMQESGGRRIKRSISIDMNTVKFCDEEMLRRFGKIQFIAEYIERKKQELAEYNDQRKVDVSNLVNGRRMTNLGTFRAYVEAYLRNHPMISRELTFLVRQLAPTDRGLPIEIYVFSKDKVWTSYEAIQADIFDHLLAILPQFDLRVYQLPTGSDLAAAAVSAAD